MFVWHGWHAEKGSGRQIAAMGWEVIAAGCRVGMILLPGDGDYKEGNRDYDRARGGRKGRKERFSGYPPVCRKVVCYEKGDKTVTNLSDCIKSEQNDNCIVFMIGKL